MQRNSYFLAAALVSLGLTCACSSDSEEATKQSDAGATDAVSEAPSYDPIPIPGSTCNAILQYHPLAASSAHVEQCSVIDYETNPPSSGPHYPNWAAFGPYDVPVPRGFWVHSMEHGAVVVSHNCTNCSAEIAKAESWLAELPADPVCVTGGAGPENRGILVPDPKLLEPWAASAWGVTLVADCFEPEVFSDFYQQTHGKAPENFCSQGIDLVSDDGGLDTPPGCGDVDPIDAGADGGT